MAQDPFFSAILADPRSVTILGALEEVGVVDALGRVAAEPPASARPARRPAELAAELGLDREVLAAVLEAAADLGLVEREAEGYRLADPLQVCQAAERGRRPDLLVTPGSLYFQYHEVLHAFRGLRRWSALPRILQEGGPATARAGASPDRDVRKFVGTMGNREPHVIRRTVADCLAKRPGARRVLDLGGGPGFFARAFAEAGPQVVLVDFPEVLELNRKQGRAWPGVEFFPADFRERLPEGPFDLIYLGNVCHMYGPDENTALFRRLYALQPPGGVLVINDFVRGRSPQAGLFALYMLLSTGSGGTWSEADFRCWLHAAGYTEVSVEDRPGGNKQFVVARKAGDTGGGAAGP